jgi:hypothetical protein
MGIGIGMGIGISISIGIGIVPEGDTSSTDTPEGGTSAIGISIQPLGHSWGIPRVVLQYYPLAQRQAN